MSPYQYNLRGSLLEQQVVKGGVTQTITNTYYKTGHLKSAYDSASGITNTHVEVYWAFDENAKLVDIAIKKTSDSF